MNGIKTNGAPSLEDFLSQHPSIKVYWPSDPDFGTVGRAFLATPARPLLIARPQSEAHVSALVGHLSSAGVPFTIRTGGHDLSARCVVNGGVQIDLRDMATVRISEDRKTAYVGGGILQIDLLSALENEGLMCAVGSTGTVGWVGWATLGGYGPFSSLYGMGCDQIVGARVVLADGRVVDADDEMLRGIRGAGPAFGVIVEVQIRVFPTTEVQGGAIMYSADNLESAVSAFWANYAAHRFRPDGLLPPQLCIQPMVFGVGETPMFFASFLWTGPADDEFKTCLAAFAGFAPGGTPQVVTATPAGFIRASSAMIPTHAYAGGLATVNLRSLQPGPETGTIMARHAARMPPGGSSLLSVHLYQAPAGAAPPPTVFANREPHIMLEIIGYATDQKTADRAGEWARAFGGEIAGAPDVMSERYYPLTWAADLKLESSYAEGHLDEMRALKGRVDPGNVFRFAVPLA